MLRAADAAMMPRLMLRCFAAAMLLTIRRCRHYAAFSAYATPMMLLRDMLRHASAAIAADAMPLSA